MKTHFIPKAVTTLCIFVIGLFANCGNSVKEENIKREQEYALLLEREYDNFLTSERYNTFKQRYELLCDITQKIDNDSVFLTLDSLPATDTLCFIPTIDWNTPPPETSFITFENYTNRSTQVTAVIVYNWFDEKNESGKKFSNEFELHEAYEALDKENYLKKCYEIDSSAEFTYLMFCGARVYMDNLNHSKYFVILKTDDVSEHILLPHTEAGDFLTGEYQGALYIYNIETQQMERIVRIVVNNSSEVTLREGTLVDDTFKKDLKENLQKKIKATLDSIYGVKGDLPDFYLN